MPLYDWRDELTGYEVTVQNSYGDYRKEPTDDQLPEEERGKERKWTKLISTGIKIARAYGYGSKGNW